MKKWYVFYNKYPEKVQQLTGVLENQLSRNMTKVHQLGREIKHDSKLQQVVAEMQFQSIFAYVPWGHHVEIITKCKSVDEAFFYIRKTIEESWSRSSLQNYIKADLYKKTGKAISNYSEILPEKQARLANEITKDSYDFGFVSLPADYDEKTLETALEKNVTRFLIELGTGFAFMGRQREIIVAGKSRRIDMLFYHTKLHCYVVIEKQLPSAEEIEKQINLSEKIIP